MFTSQNCKKSRILIDFFIFDISRQDQFIYLSANNLRHIVIGCGFSNMQKRRYKMQVEGFRINNSSMSNYQFNESRKKTLYIIKEVSGLKERSLFEENLMDTH